MFSFTFTFLSEYVNRVASAARLLSYTSERARIVFASHAASANVVASNTLVDILKKIIKLTLSVVLKHPE